MQALRPCLSHGIFTAQEEEEEKEVLVDCPTEHCTDRLSLEELIVSLKEEVLSQPSIKDFAHMLQKCGKEGDRAHALRLHAYVVRSGLEMHRSLGNDLVCMLGEVDNLCDAQRVFDSLVYQDDLSWQTLITGYLKCGHIHHALNLYKRMQNIDTIHLDGHTFVALLKAC
eukprot:c25164_g2_i1 orf=184-690(+)